MPALARRLVPALTVASLALVAPTAADAQVVVGKVIAPATGAKPAKLPVLLSESGARALGRPVVTVAVRGKRPVRWGSDRLALKQLRPGDELSLDVAGKRARTVRLRQSGRADAFAYVFRSLARTGTSSERSVQDLQAILAGKEVDLDKVRDRLTKLQARLMGLRTDLGTSLTRLRAVQPDAGKRRKAVQGAQQRYAGQIAAVRKRAGIAAAQTRDALAGLGAGPPLGQSGEGTTVPVPGGPIQLPGVVGTVSELTGTLLQLLTDLGLLETPQTGNLGSNLLDPAPPQPAGPNEGSPPAENPGPLPILPLP